MKGNKMIKYLFLFLVLVFQLKWIWAQNSTSDSLQNVSYNYLEEKSDTALSDSLKKFYAQAYLTKAKKNKETNRIAEGFFLMSEAYSTTKQGITYADSILQFTKNLHDYKYPAEGYLQKGIQLYYNSQYELALDNFIMAEKKAKQQDNTLQQVAVKHYIGLLKNVNSEIKEALNYFRENLEFIEGNNLQRDNEKLYLKTLFALTDSYNKNQLIDSAEIICRKGLEVSRLTKNNYLYPQFLSSYGVTSVFKGEIDVGLDSLLKGSSLILNKKKQLGGIYYIIARLYSEKKQDSISISYFNKIDSMYAKHPEVIFSANRAYKFLLKYYRRKNDINNQIAIIDKVISTDSIINHKEGNLSKDIVKKYEIPFLVTEKEKLIKKLERKDIYNNRIKIALYLLIIFLSSMMFYYYIRNMLNKKRFNALLEEYSHQKNLPNEISKSIKKNKLADLSEELVKKTLDKLSEFEKSHRFVKQQYTLNKLAKELDTNSSYLSKIINSSKNKTFPNYYNDLRVNYAIDQLARNKKLRLYTIQAIAEEVGFQSAQSFTSAFYRKSGIYPSFFIKQLKKQKINVND